MIKRLTALFIIIPIGIIILTLAVANRQMVELAVPQFGDKPLFLFNLPLFAVIFASVFMGMIVGSFSTWLKQGKHRKEARTQKVEATKLGFEAEKQKARADALENTSADDTLSKYGLLPAPAKSG